MVTGKWNKGEWSELYVLLRLLAEGKLYAGNADLDKIPGIFFQIIGIVRSETDSLIRYNRASNFVNIIDGKTDKKILSLSIKEFDKQSDDLLKAIKSGKGPSFYIPAAEKFAKTIKCFNLKSKSSKKSDIAVVIHDTSSSVTSKLDFSVKSMLGGKSTLFNSSKKSNFIYQILNKSLTGKDIKRINSIATKSKIRDRVKSIYDEGCVLGFVKTEGETFGLNLKMIDTMLPNILSEVVQLYFRNKGPKAEKIISVIEKDNPCRFDNSQGHKFYTYKMKKFLVDAALGLTASKKWQGQYDATGGYIVVKNSGELVCYHIIRVNDFEDYLFKNTILETPDPKRHDFGKIYDEGGLKFFKLNLQVRFD